MKIIITDVVSYLFVHLLAIAMLMPPKGKLISVYYMNIDSCSLPPHKDK